MNHHARLSAATTCLLVWAVPLVLPACVGGEGELICSDGIDEDGNGLTDCEDLACVCVEDCTSGLDDDKDGDVDCEDQDCVDAPECDTDTDTGTGG